MRRKSWTMAAVVAVAIASVTAVPAAADQQAKPKTVAAAENCPEPDKAVSGPVIAGERVCVTATPRPGVTASPKPSDVGPSAAPCGTNTWYKTRSEACMWQGLTVTIWGKVCDPRCQDVPTGAIEVEATYRSKAFPFDEAWNLWVHLHPIRAVGSGHDGVNVTGNFLCAGSCYPRDGGQFTPQVLKVGQDVSDTGWLVSQIGPAGTAKGKGGVKLIFKKDGKPGVHEMRAEPETRCDSRPGSTGCVFWAVPAVWDFPSHLYPQAAWHIKAAQKSGLLGHDLPLHYITNEGLRDRNRRIACGDAPSLDGKSCDEYPFASTLEGAKLYGKDYGRTFYGGPDGTGCEMDHLPPGFPGDGPEGWSACMIDEDDNEESGGALGNFYVENRVIEMEGFYVEVDD